MTTPQVDEEAAFHFIVRSLRDKSASTSKYGYAVYLSKIIDDFLTSVHGVRQPHATTLPHETSPAFYDAAWELARASPRARRLKKPIYNGLLDRLAEHTQHIAS